MRKPLHEKDFAHPITWLYLTGFGNLSGLIQHCGIYFMHVPKPTFLIRKVFQAKVSNSEPFA